MTTRNSVKNAKNIEIIFTENDLTISKKMTNCSCYDLLFSTYEIISKLYDKQTVTNAIDKLNTDVKPKPKEKSEAKSGKKTKSKSTSSESTSTQTKTKLAA